jgi:hypothetical protein
MAHSFGFFDLTFGEALAAAHGQSLERASFVGGGAQAEREIYELDVPRIPALDLVAV